MSDHYKAGRIVRHRLTTMTWKIVGGGARLARLREENRAKNTEEAL